MAHAPMAHIPVDRHYGPQSSQNEAEWAAVAAELIILIAATRQSFL